MMKYNSVNNPAWADPDQTQLDCIVDFVGIGSVSFTASESDSEGHSRDIFARAVAGDFGPIAPYVAPPPQSPEQIKERLRRAVEDHVEETARERDYSSAVSLASYTASTREPWAAEAQAFVHWRDDVWEYVFQRLAAVESGEDEPPESAEALIADLPEMVWPE